MTETVSTEINSPKKIYELESIRGIAAFFIVLVHIPTWNTNFYDWRFIANSYLMVELFFVLSGFVIWNAYSEKISTGKELLRFQFLRFARLYPVHLLFLLAFFSIEIAKYIATVKFSIPSPNTTPFMENSITAFVQQLFLVQAIGPTGNTYSFNGPAWTISVEFYTYLVFGLIVLCMKKYSNLAFILLFIISIVLVATESTFGFVNLLRCFAGFFAGCFVAILSSRFNVKINPIYSLLSFAVVALFIALKKPFSQDWIMYIISGLLILTLVKSEGGALRRVLNFKAFVWLGTISYSLYMSHFAIIWFINQVVRFTLRRPEVSVSGVMAPRLTIFETSIAYIIVIASVLLISALVYKYVENPLRLRSRKVVI